MADQGRRVLAEQDRLAWHVHVALGRVVAIIQAEADDLGRVRHRRQQRHLGGLVPRRPDRRRRGRPRDPLRAQGENPFDGRRQARVGVVKVDVKPLELPAGPRATLGLDGHQSHRRCLSLWEFRRWAEAAQLIPAKPQRPGGARETRPHVRHLSLTLDSADARLEPGRIGGLARGDGRWKRRFGGDRCRWAGSLERSAGTGGLGWLFSWPSWWSLPGPGGRRSFGAFPTSAIPSTSPPSRPSGSSTTATPSSITAWPLRRPERPRRRSRPRRSRP